MSDAVACPRCNSTVTTVLRSTGSSIFGPIVTRRRRKCAGCENRFTTFEIPVLRFDAVAAIWKTKADLYRVR